MITDEQRAEWRRVTAKATPEPWAADLESVCVDSGNGPLVEIGEFCETGEYTLQDQANAIFAAVARTAVPALLDENDDLRRQLEQATADITALHDERTSEDPAEVIDGFLKYWRRYYPDALSGAVILGRERQVVRAVIEAAQKALPAMLAAEFSAGDDMDECPCCFGHVHRDGCEYARALAALKAALGVGE